MRGYRGPTALFSLPGADTETELGAIRFTLMFSVPKGTDRQSLAQELADQWRLLSCEGEEIAAAADVHVPEGLPEFNDDAHESPVRPSGPGRSAVGCGRASTAVRSARTWLQERYPVPGQVVSIMPLDDLLTDSFVSVSRFVARTSGPLPADWEEHLARHR